MRSKQSHSNNEYIALFNDQTNDVMFFISKRNVFCFFGVNVESKSKLFFEQLETNLFDVTFLQALLDVSDSCIYSYLVSGRENDDFWKA